MYKAYVLGQFTQESSSTCETIQCKPQKVENRNGRKYRPEELFILQSQERCFADLRNTW